MKTLMFVFYRFMWEASIQALRTCYRCGVPKPLGNGIVLMLGMRWAFHGMRKLGWHPDAMNVSSKGVSSPLLHKKRLRFSDVVVRNARVLRWLLQRNRS